MTQEDKQLLNDRDMKSRKPKNVNLKHYDMWTDEDYEAAIPEEIRKEFDRAITGHEIQELVNKMCSEKTEKGK